MRSLGVILPPRPKKKKKKKDKGKEPDDELLDKFLEALIRKCPGTASSMPLPHEDDAAWNILVDVLIRECRGSTGESSALPQTGRGEQQKRR